ncbi:MAG: mandelate racemase/muconate lactonizing enzyme family protein [Dehalococcoidia bacterium]
MKITNFRTRVVKLSGERGPLGEIPGQVNTEFVTLEVHTSEGITGVSFAGYAGYAGSLTAALKATLDALCGQIVGRDPFDTEAIGNRLRSANGGAAPGGLVTRAAAAIDVALWDIKGKALNLPLWKLLGGERGRTKAYGSGHLWRHYSVAELVEWAPKLVENGFTSMKLRCGTAGASEASEVERLRVLRETVGPDVDIMIDINQLWNVHQATKLGRRFQEYNLFWLEDPVHHQDYAGMARIAAALDVPVCSGEYHYGIVPFRHMLAAESIDIAMIDLFRVGGITPFLKAAHLAEAFNIPVVSHLATELFAAAMCAIPNALSVEHVPWTFPLWQEVPRVEGGEIVLSDRPGLGLSFNEELLARSEV